MMCKRKLAYFWLLCLSLPYAIAGAEAKEKENSESYWITKKLRSGVNIASSTVASYIIGNNNDTNKEHTEENDNNDNDHSDTNDNTNNDTNEDDMEENDNSDSDESDTDESESDIATDQPQNIPQQITDAIENMPSIQLDNVALTINFKETSPLKLLFYLAEKDKTQLKILILDGITNAQRETDEPKIDRCLTDQHFENFHTTVSQQINTFLDTINDNSITANQLYPALPPPGMNSKRALQENALFQSLEKKTIGGFVWEDYIWCHTLKKMQQDSDGKHTDAIKTFVISRCDLINRNNLVLLTAANYSEVIGFLIKKKDYKNAEELLNILLALCENDEDFSEELTDDIDAHIEQWLTVLIARQDNQHISTMLASIKNKYPGQTIDKKRLAYIEQHLITQSMLPTLWSKLSKTEQNTIQENYFSDKGVPYGLGPTQKIRKKTTTMAPIGVTENIDQQLKTLMEENKFDDAVAYLQTDAGNNVPTNQLMQTAIHLLYKEDGAYDEGAALMIQKICERETLPPFHKPNNGGKSIEDLLNALAKRYNESNKQRNALLETLLPLDKGSVAKNKRWSYFFKQCYEKTVYQQIRPFLPNTLRQHSGLDKVLYLFKKWNGEDNNDLTKLNKAIRHLNVLSDTEVVDGWVALNEVDINQNDVARKTMKETIKKRLQKEGLFREERCGEDFEPLFERIEDPIDAIEIFIWHKQAHKIPSKLWLSGFKVLTQEIKEAVQDNTLNKKAYPFDLWAEFFYSKYRYDQYEKKGEKQEDRERAIYIPDEDFYNILYDKLSNEAGYLPVTIIQWLGTCFNIGTYANTHIEALLLNENDDTESNYEQSYEESEKEHSSKKEDEEQEGNNYLRDSLKNCLKAYDLLDGPLDSHLVNQQATRAHVKTAYMGHLDVNAIATTLTIYDQQQYAKSVIEKAKVEIEIEREKTKDKNKTTKYIYKTVDTLLSIIKDNKITYAPLLALIADIGQLETWSLSQLLEEEKNKLYVIQKGLYEKECFGTIEHKIFRNKRPFVEVSTITTQQEIPYTQEETAKIKQWKQQLFHKQYKKVALAIETEEKGHLFAIEILRFLVEKGYKKRRKYYLTDAHKLFKAFPLPFKQNIPFFGGETSLGWCNLFDPIVTTNNDQDLYTAHFQRLGGNASKTIVPDVYEASMLRALQEVFGQTKPHKVVLPNGREIDLPKPSDDQEEEEIVEEVVVETVEQNNSTQNNNSTDNNIDPATIVPINTAPHKSLLQNRGGQCFIAAIAALIVVGLSKILRESYRKKNKIK